MPRRTIDVSRFLEAGFDLDTAPIETPAQKRERIQVAMQRAAETAGRAGKEGINDHIMHENNVMRKAYRRATSDLTLDMRDLMGGLGNLPAADLFPEERAGMGMRGGNQFLTEEFPTHQDDMIMDDLYNYDRPSRSAVQQVQQKVQRRPLSEDMSPVQRRPVSNDKLTLREPRGSASAENWIAKKYLGETRGGDTVPIWKVQNKKTGSSFDKLFRLEGVATRIALMLNESGDQNDPRVVSLVGAYDKRDKLLKEARVLEKSADGKPMKTDRLRAIRAEINQLEYRLGI